MQIALEYLGAPGENGGIALDPFGYLPACASKVEGLGGQDVAFDPRYVFHSPYVSNLTGLVGFHIRFDGLEAGSGTLELRVHAFRYGSVQLASRYPLQLVEIIRDGGRASIYFDASPDCAYACVGLLFGDHRAQADALSLAYSSRTDKTAAELADLRRTTFGTPRVRRTTALSSPDRPTLARPVSQPCTVDQFNEPAMAAWTQRLGLPASDDPAQWEAVFPLQALQSYGFLADGSQGLLIGDPAAATRSALAAAGCYLMDAVVAPAPPADSEPATAADDAPPVVAIGNPPAGLSDFDFLISRGIGQVAASVAEVGQFIEESMRFLKPGGMAIHLLPYTPLAERPEQGPLMLIQNDVSAILLNMIGLMHQVVQLKAGNMDFEDRESMFGLILFKGNQP
jgi:hypothetical protein